MDKGENKVCVPGVLFRTLWFILLWPPNRLLVTEAPHVRFFILGFFYLSIGMTLCEYSCH